MPRELRLVAANLFDEALGVLAADVGSRTQAFGLSSTTALGHRRGKDISCLRASGRSC